MSAYLPICLRAIATYTQGMASGTQVHDHNTSIVPCEIIHHDRLLVDNWRLRFIVIHVIRKIVHHDISRLLADNWRNLRSWSRWSRWSWRSWQSWSLRSWQSTRHTVVYKGYTKVNDIEGRGGGRLPGSPTWLTYLAHLPGSPTWLTYLLTYLAHLPGSPTGSPTWLTYRLTYLAHLAGCLVYSSLHPP
jgi:hypothetical protein